jgi:hypothetical protein
MINKRFMTRAEFEQLMKEDKYYYEDRWTYFSKVFDIIGSERFGSVLELGTYNKPIVRDADTMDIRDSIKNLTYKWDATKTPWPIKDKQYDLFIGLQVWEHLGDKQQEAFKEVMRISKMAVLSFPYMWECPGNCHHQIDIPDMDRWTLNVEPILKIHSTSRIIYFFKFV